MMKKFKEHCNRPITWGKYYKLCSISAILSIIFTVGYWIYLTKDLYTFKSDISNEGIEEEEA